jgi:orotate phosphoribosyltransferase/AMMECR1 domain-containing protein
VTSAFAYDGLLKISWLYYPRGARITVKLRTLEPPSNQLSARERLRLLLRSEAIIRSSRDQPIFDRTGKPMRWIFYSWAVNLSYEGASLAAECFLDALKKFESVQLASVGLTALPLVSSVVAHGCGRYYGLCVRPEHESWGTRRQVEGAGDRSKSVVVVDDSLCSGNSLRRAIIALEEDGYRVEGAVCLVNFPWKGGTEWATALGYRVETILDIWQDLHIAEYQSVSEYTLDASRIDPVRRVPDGLSPADAARWVSVHFLKCGVIPRPPGKFDGDYDARGGVMVSFRDRTSNYRVARNGFYRFTSENGNLCSDVVLATARTLLASGEAIARYGLDRLKLGVTLFSENVPIVPRQLDFSRFGILLQSKVQPGKHGGALPNTQFFVSELQQLHHARFTNAHLFPFEPFTIFRHAVNKSVESGCTWPWFGVSVAEIAEPDSIGELLVARAREILRSAEAGTRSSAKKLPTDLFSKTPDAIAVSLYHRGLIGCWISSGRDLDAMLSEAAIGALHDERHRPEPGVRLTERAVVVSVLHIAEVLGSMSCERAAFKLRLGKDSLSVWKDQKRSILLSHTACHYDWNKKEMAERTLAEAGISNGPAQWSTYKTQSWLGHQGRVLRLEFGYPQRSGSEVEVCSRATVRLLSDYIVDKIRPAVLPEYCYFPVTGRRVVRESASRVILALESLWSAGVFLDDQRLCERARAGLHHCCEHITTDHGLPRLDLPGIRCGPGADVLLVNAVYRSGKQSLINMPGVQHLKQRVHGFFHGDGAITCKRPGIRLNSDHDLFPGFVLRMAASVADIEGAASLPRTLPEHLHWYQRRFRLLHAWGMVWWQIQGWAPIHGLICDERMASFVYELADWALLHQLDKNGAFLVDYYPDGPGFHTACVLEGIGEAWNLARRSGDDERARNYAQSWKRGIAFINRLIIREEETFAMSEPARALGGVRESLTSSRVRIDYVAHALLALLKGCGQIAASV